MLGRSAGARNARASIALIALVACAHPPAEPQPITLPDSGATYFPGDAWRTLPARGAGMNEGQLAALSADMTRGRYGSLNGVVVIRYGFVVFEQYNFWSREQIHT